MSHGNKQIFYTTFFKMLKSELKKTLLMYEFSLTYFIEHTALACLFFCLFEDFWNNILKSGNLYSDSYRQKQQKWEPWKNKFLRVFFPTGKLGRKMMGLFQSQGSKHGEDEQTNVGTKPDSNKQTNICWKLNTCFQPSLRKVCHPLAG